MKIKLIAAFGVEVFPMVALTKGHYPENRAIKPHFFARLKSNKDNVTFLVLFQSTMGERAEDSPLRDHLFHAERASRSLRT